MADATKKYKDLPVLTKGHKFGYVSELDIDKSNMHPESVIDCLNMNFREGQDERRLPYLQLASLTLPSGYIIHNYCQKRFFDSVGNYQDCIIVVATKTSSPTKIYIDHWYNPSSATAENNTGGTTGFISGWVEITEYYDTSDYEFTVGTYNYEGSLWQIRSYDAGIYARDNKYFNGFFVTQTDGSVIGTVLESKKISHYADVEGEYTYSTRVTPPDHKNWFSNSGTYIGPVGVQAYKICSYIAEGIEGGYQITFKWSKDATPNWNTANILTVITADGAGNFTETSPIALDNGLYAIIKAGNVGEYICYVDDNVHYDMVTFNAWSATYFRLFYDTNKTPHKITRFPVTHFNYDNWDNIITTDV